MFISQTNTKKTICPFSSTAESMCPLLPAVNNAGLSMMDYSLFSDLSSTAVKMSNFQPVTETAFQIRLFSLVVLIALMSV